MLDRINEDLVSQNQELVAFEMDCREGICDSCSAKVTHLSLLPQGEPERSDRPEMASYSILDTTDCMT